MILICDIQTVQTHKYTTQHLIQTPALIQYLFTLIWEKEKYYNVNYLENEFIMFLLISLLGFKIIKNWMEIFILEFHYLILINYNLYLHCICMGSQIYAQVFVTYY